MIHFIIDYLFNDDILMEEMTPILIFILILKAVFQLVVIFYY